jgi:elongation factor Ts
MATISAKDVKALRESTGAGMMDCKKVLTEANGDPKKAVELLRERGLSKAGKRAGRETSEGAIAVAVSGGQGSIIELGCETDFVAKTDDFRELAQSIVDVVRADGSADSPEKALELALGDSTVADTITATAAKVGENVILKRVNQVGAGGTVGAYVHAGGKLGVVLAIAGGSSDEISTAAKDLAMHVAAIDPTPVAVDRDGVSAELVESEKAILRSQAIQSGKPENIVEKIVDGRINKFYAENCLMEQPFVKDPDTSVGELLAGIDKGLKVDSFVRFKLGEVS